MKFTKYLFLLILIHGLSINSAKSEISRNETPFSYGRKDFCKEEAKIRFNNLNEMTKSDVEQIEKLKKDINDLEARKKIISDLTTIRNDYVGTIESLVSDEDSTIKKNIKIENVAKFKTLLRNAMTLNALSLLMKDQSSPIPTSTPNLESLCENISSNSNLALCKNYNPRNLDSLSAWWKKDEIAGLNKTLENFSNAMKQVTDKNTVDGEIKEIYDSIPKNIAPEIILEVLANKSPTLKEFLLNAHSKDEVLNCLNENDSSCENLISNPDNKKNLNALLGEEEQKLKIDLKSRYAQVKNQITLKYTSDLSKIMDNDTKTSEIIGEKNKIATETDGLKTKLDQLINHNPRLEKIEKLKQYIAQRFMRSCPQTKESENTLVSNILAIKCNNMKSSSDMGNIQELSNSFANILGKLQEDNSVYYNKKEINDLGIFSKSELTVFNESCKDIGSVPAITETCKDIADAYNKTPKKKEAKDWDKFNNDYIVEYNPMSKNGYAVYRRKSNSRILGEAFVQNIGRAFPIWMENYQLSNQIEMMTNQALYMQQINYMNNPGSPWMPINPYFQGSYFNTTAMPTTTSGGFGF